MSVRSFTLSVLAVLWLCSPSACAQFEQWQGHMDAGAEAYRQGNYPEAEKQLVAALTEGEGFGPQDPRLATTLTNHAVDQTMERGMCRGDERRVMMLVAVVAIVIVRRQGSTPLI